MFKNRLSVPALAERRADLAVMVDYFVRQQAKQIGRVVDGVSPESMRRLEAYSWPGNIRELRTVVERAVLVSRSTVLEIDQESLDERVTVGSYRLITRLGAGGMGEVWLARHKLLRRPAALKLIRPDVRSGAEHEQLVRRFEREAQVTSALRSPHTVQLYDFGVNDTGGFYYVMELLHGLDLEQIVSRFGAQPAERVIMLLRQACRSLAEAHDHGIVHRDIKPANLFVSRLGYEDDYLKVLDFGIVKGTAGDGQTALSAPGILQGTPAYMAPELITRRGRARQARGSLRARLRGVHRLDRATRLWQQNAGANALASSADHTTSAVAQVTEPHSRGTRRGDHGVPRETPSQPTNERAGVGSAARAGPVRTRLDARAGACLVGRPRPGPSTRAERELISGGIPGSFAVTRQ